MERVVRGGGSEWRRWPPLAAQVAVGVLPTRWRCPNDGPTTFTRRGRWPQPAALRSLSLRESVEGRGEAWCGTWGWADSRQTSESNMLRTSESPTRFTERPWMACKNLRGLNGGSEHPLGCIIPHGSSVPPALVRQQSTTERGQGKQDMCHPSSSLSNQACALRLTGTGHACARDAYLPPPVEVRSRLATSDAPVERHWWWDAAEQLGHRRDTTGLWLVQESADGPAPRWGMGSSPHVGIAQATGGVVGEPRLRVGLDPPPDGVVARRATRRHVHQQKHPRQHGAARGVTAA